MYVFDVNSNVSAKCGEKSVSHTDGFNHFTGKH